MRLAILLILFCALLVFSPAGINSSSASPIIKSTFPASSQIPMTPEAVQEAFKVLDEYTRITGKEPDIKTTGNDEKSGRMVIAVPQESILGISLPIPQSYNLDLSLIEIPNEVISEAVSTVFLRDPGAKAGSLEGVKVKQLGASENYEVVEDYSYKYGENQITVPKGFVFDRASVPRVFWIIIDKDSLSNVAPVFHDFLYRNGGKVDPKKLVSPYRSFSREEADNLFLELMTKCGVTKARRTAAYQAVRNFGESSWKKKQL